MEEPVVSSDRTAEVSLACVRTIFGDYHPRNFSVRLWNGDEWGPEEGRDAKFTLVLRHPGALRNMFLPLNELTLGEAYIYGDFDIEGDIGGAFALADHLLSKRFGFAARARLGWKLHSIPANDGNGRESRTAFLDGERHSRDRDRSAVTFHYDVSNEFFASFLDGDMQYSCAYFGSVRDDLDAAQSRKLDYLCRKLRLQPGDRLLDIGCGWGGLVMRAVTGYGADAVGITLSQAQADLARDRIRKAGLRHLCHVSVADYRDFIDIEGFHKIVSVGMFEHVGESRLNEYFQRVWDLLQPGGMFLNHGIAHPVSRHGMGNPSFVFRHVFPDGEILPLDTVIRAAESCGFEVRDVESLREHYDLTLRDWGRRLDANRDRALDAVDEAAWRTWRLYMAGSAHAFRTGRLNVYQALFVKPNHGVSGFPLTRDDWYTGEFGERRPRSRKPRGGARPRPVRTAP